MTGVPILTNIAGFNARLAVEFVWGANLLASDATWTWSDETANVMRDHGSGVTISPMGRSNETTQAQPAQCVFKLRNTTGAYTPYNPMASNWPNVTPGTPVRVRLSLDGGVTWAVRFQGYANGFPPGWDKSARKAVVTVTASGISRRLGQGSNPLRSALYRAITTATPAPIAYWPMEDGSAAVQCVSATGGAPMVLTTAPYPTFASAGPGGSAPVVGFGPGTPYDTRSFGLTTIPASTVDTYWAVQAVAKFSASSGSVWQFLDWTSASTWPEFCGLVGSNGTMAFKSLQNGILTDICVTSGHDYRDDTWHQWTLTASASGGNVTFRIVVDGVQVATATVATTIKHIVAVGPGQLGPLSGNTWIGHIQVYDQAPTDFTTAMGGWVGETPGARMTRLCAEEGVPFSIVDFYDTSQTMGPQGVDTFANLLRECERTDNGFLYDGLSAGWRYQGVSQRYDQATGFTLDMAQHHLLDLVPVDDDQRRRNKQRVDRKSASFAEAEDATGPLGTAAIGEYKSQLTVNTADDTQLYNRASWEVWAGTIAGLRYPTLHPNLMRMPSLGAAFLSRTDGVSGPVVPGCRVDVTNISTVATQHTLGTVSLVLEGYSEFISKDAWTVTLNCSQNRQYDVVKIGDSQLGRPDTDGAYLSAAAGNGATSLTVATTAGVPLWTTTAAYPADFPFNANVDGLQVAVSAIASVATDGFTRTVSNGWGSADSGQAWSTSGGTAAAYSVGTGWGQMSLSAVATEYSTLLDVGSSDAKVAIDVQFPVAAATGAAIRLRLGVRATDQNNLYYAQLELDTTGTMRLIIAKRVGGVSTTLSSNVVVGTNNANDWWHLEMSAVGSTLTALGQDLTNPSGPQLLTLTDTAIASGTKVSALATLVTGYSGATPVTIAWDHMEVSNPQTFTVGALPRAVAAGRTVSLWNPGAIKF